jgi:competence protein ComEC
MNLKYYLFLLFLISALLFIRFYTFYASIPELIDGQAVIIRTNIINEPEIEGKFQRFSIIVRSHRIFITTVKYPIYRYGEFLEIRGKVKVSEKEGKVFYSLVFPEIRALHNNANVIMRVSLFIRERAIDIFESALSPIHSALLLGIVFGIKQNMPDEFLDILRDGGVVHVIAASGMNVSMVAGSLFFITVRFMRRRMALLVSMIGLLIYVCIAGFEASIIRAAIMSSIAFAAGITGRKRLPLYTLFLTALFMLFINPTWITDVGFQLSFMATAGILTLKPIFDLLFERIVSNSIGAGRLGSISDDLNTTLAATLATVPILLTNFGSVNLLSILINMLVLWTIPFLMIIGGISIILGLFFTQLGQIIAYFTLPLLMYFELVVRYFDRFKIPIMIDNSSPVLWIGYYLILASFLIFIRKKRNVISEKNKENNR